MFRRLGAIACCATGIIVTGGDSSYGARNDWAEGTPGKSTGASRDYYNSAGLLKWKHFMGDWRDAADVAQGNKPFAATSVVSDGKTKPVEWDVTLLVRQWLDGKSQNQGFFLRPVKGDGSCVFHSREHADNSQRPQLIIVTDKASRTLSPTADTYLAPSTYRSMGNNTDLRVGGKVPTLLRFDLNELGKTVRVKQATLRLVTFRQYGRKVDIGVFRCSQGHRLPPSDPIPGLAARYPGDEGIGDDGDVRCRAQRMDSYVYPGKAWAMKTPAEVGLNAEKLQAFSKFVGGRGCVVRRGYMVYSWGDVSKRADVASACKPFYSHFLWKAIEDGKIKSAREKAVKWEPRLNGINKDLGYKDREIRWRDFANQTSCYQLTEKPGTAYAYNDWQMALFWDTLFLKVYGVTYKTVDDKVFRPLLTEKIQCEDNPTMMAFGTRGRPGRVGVSVRDFARFGLLYLREGNWKGKQLISREHAKLAVSSPLPNSIPRAGRKAAEMIRGQRSIGSGSKPDNQTDHFGSYSWLWWINGVDRKGTRMFPDAPHDTYGAFGHGGPRAMWVIPSLDIIVSYNDAKMRS